MSLTPVGFSSGVEDYAARRSLRLRGSVGGFLNQTNLADSKKFSISFFFKRGVLTPSSATTILGWSNGVDTSFAIGLNNDRLEVADYQTAYTLRKVTTRVLRDCANWFHINVCVDTTNPVASDRCIIEINSVRETAFDASIDPALNLDTYFGRSLNYRLFQQGGTGGLQTDGYISQFYVISNSVQRASAFLTLDPLTRQLIAKPYSGPYPTGSSYLDFFTTSNIQALGFNKATGGFAPYNATCVGVSSISTAQSKFGGSSLSFNGAPGSYAGIAANPAYNLGAGVFCVEAWVYDLGKVAPSGLNGNNTIVSQGNNASNLRWDLNISNDTRLVSWGFTGARVVATGYPAPINTWHHIVVTRDASNNERIFLNGVLISFRNNTTNYSGVSSTDTALGASYDSNYPGVYGISAHSHVLNGYLQDVAITVGQVPPEYATVSSTLGQTIFTPPTQQLAVGPGNQTWNYKGFIVPCNGANGATTTPVNLPLNWVVNNVSLTAGATYDSMIDVPIGSLTDRGNFGVWNPNDSRTNKPVNGNLRAGHNAGEGTRGTFWTRSGKWYCEFVFDTATNGVTIGIGNISASLASFPGSDVHALGYSAGDGNKYNGGVATAYGATWGVGDIIGMAYDLDNGRIWWAKNGVWQASGDPAAGINPAFTGLAGAYAPMFGINPAGSGSGCSANFGQRPFAYTPPAGFKALHDGNLADPPIFFPERHHKPVAYIGRGTQIPVTQPNGTPYASFLANNALGNSLRLREAALGNLSRNPSGVSNRRTYTISCWLRPASITYSGASQYGRRIFNATTAPGAADSNVTGLQLATDNCIAFNHYTGGAGQYYGRKTRMPLTDPSKWYHVFVAVDTTHATESERMRIFIDGARQTTVLANTVIPLNLDTSFNFNSAHVIGRDPRTTVGGDTGPYEGYISKVYLIDGQALDPSEFGQYDPLFDMWVPKDYSGGYGTNGFYLPFSDTTSLTTLAADFSGQNNNWTANNISLAADTTYDAMVDCATNRFPILTPLSALNGAATYFRQGNLSLQDASNSGSWRTAHVDTGLRAGVGKWYWELKIEAIGPSIGSQMVLELPAGYNALANPPSSSQAYGIYWNTSNYQKLGNGSLVNLTGTPAAGDTIGVAYDAVTGSLWFARNNIWFEGNPSAGTGASFTGITLDTIIALSVFSNNAGGGGNAGGVLNFGQRPLSYSPPTGFVPLCSANLPKASTEVFRPGYLVIKDRGVANTWAWASTARGDGLQLASPSTAGQTSTLNATRTTFPGGLLVGQDVTTGTTNDNYVSWMWRTSNRQSINTDGNLRSFVRANVEAGISVVLYDGVRGAVGVDTVGHGLTRPLDVILSKSVNTTGGDSGQWAFRHRSLLNWNYYLRMNAADVVTDSVSNGNTPAPTSQVFSANWTSGLNVVGNTYEALCIAATPGFSAYGLYIGSASTDGPNIWTGFEVATLIVKRVDAVSGWYIWDNARNPFNPVTNTLYPHATLIENTVAAPVDFYSNGFKIRGGSGLGINDSGGQYVYLAFAKTPSKFALAR